MDTTQHDLKILSLCYYIMAGINGAYVLLAGAYFSFIGAMLTKIPMNATKGQPLPEWLPGFLAAIGAVLVGLGLLNAACLAGAAWALPKRRNYLLVMIAAVLSCLQIPFGTALGVFTFVVLNRQGVRESFDTGYQSVPAQSRAGGPPPVPPAW